MAALGESVASACTLPKADPTSRRAKFECVCPPPLRFDDYMAHILQVTLRLGCHPDDCATAAAAAVELMRRAAASGELPLSELTVHRVGLACFVIARQMVCDIGISSSLMARMGGVSSQDLNICVRNLLVVLDWRTIVSSAEASAALEWAHAGGAAQEHVAKPPCREISEETPVPASTSTSSSSKLLRYITLARHALLSPLSRRSVRSR